MPAHETTPRCNPLAISPSLPMNAAVLSGPITPQVLDAVAARFLLENLKAYGIWEIELRQVGGQRRYVQTLDEITPGRQQVYPPEGDFTDLEESILMALLEKPLKVEEIAEECDADSSQLYGVRGLKRLEGIGLVKRLKRGQGYDLTDAGRKLAEQFLGE